MSELDDLLRAVPFFAGAGETALERLKSQGTIVSYDAEQCVFAEDDAADRLYVILDGAVRVVGSDERAGGERVETELAVLGRGDYFGEMALLSGGRRSATVICLQPSTFFALERDRFFELAKQSTELLTELVRNLTTKMRGSNERFLEQLLEKEQLQSQMEIRRHRALSEMVVGVAHELNTPLGIINNAASVIARCLKELHGEPEELDAHEVLADALDAVQLVLKNVNRANRLLERFRSISVMQHSDTRQHLNLPLLVEEVVELRRLQTRQTELEVCVRSHLDAGQEHWSGYPRYLSQVLECLLANVERHAYGPLVSGRVEIELWAVPSRIEPRFALAVRDFGRGITAEDLPHIFDPFFTTARSAGALGLGLSIARNIVITLLGGSIRAQSIPGQGTTITVEFPQVLEESTGGAAQLPGGDGHAGR